MLTKLKECADRLATNNRKKEGDVADIRLRFEKAALAFDTLSIVYAGRYAMYVCDTYEAKFSQQVIIKLDVSDMTEVEPLLASLENAFGIVFDKSSDRAEVGWRQFGSKAAPWLRVDAHPKADAAGCRAEVVGYDQTPKYEFKCD